LKFLASFQTSGEYVSDRDEPTGSLSWRFFFEKPTFFFWCSGLTKNRKNSKSPDQNFDQTRLRESTFQTQTSTWVSSLRDIFKIPYIKFSEILWCSGLLKNRKNSKSPDQNFDQTRLRESTFQTRTSTWTVSFRDTLLIPSHFFGPKFFLSPHSGRLEKILSSRPKFRPNQTSGERVSDPDEYVGTVVARHFLNSLYKIFRNSLVQRLIEKSKNFQSPQTKISTKPDFGRARFTPRRVRGHSRSESLS